MRIQYTNKFFDILVFNVIHQFFSPAIQGVFLLLIAFIFWADSLTHCSITSNALAATRWYIGIWVFQFLFNALYLWSRKNHAALTQHTVEIQDDAFYEETAFNRSYFYWNGGVIKAIKRAGYIAVYVTPQMAHIIPSRAFPSSMQRDEFLALLRAKIHA